MRYVDGYILPVPKKNLKVLAAHGILDKLKGGDRRSIGRVPEVVRQRLLSALEGPPDGALRQNGRARKKSKRPPRAAQG